MTEAGWLASSEPARMLEFLQRKVSDRKLRLFACACVRHIWDKVEAPFHPAVEAAERFADGVLPVADLEAAYEEAYGLTGDNPCPGMDAAMCCCPEYAGGAAQAAILASRGAANEVAETALRAVLDTAGDGEPPIDAGSEAMEAARDVEQRAQAQLLREVMGDPFRRITADPAWLAADVASLARAAYDERLLPSGELDAVRLSILTDALEEAGCKDEAIVTHLRSPGPHVRGCWAVDLILGKS